MKLVKVYRYGGQIGWGCPLCGVTYQGVQVPISMECDCDHA